jgi:hypothetical protein
MSSIVNAKNYLIQEPNGEKSRMNICNKLHWKKHSSRISVYF